MNKAIMVGATMSMTWLLGSLFINSIIVHRYVIWHRLILVCLIAGVIDTLCYIIKLRDELHLVIALAEGITINFYCFEDDDHHNKRKKKRQEAIKEFKRELSLHGWQPGAKIPQS